MPRRRRQSHALERVLGTPALFATAYGNVGSSIYYALGVTAAIALGLTPLVFVVSGLIFACTAATYAEGTVLFPEAGGSSSFARHAFNELVSFGAAWAQMLNYIITVAISAFFVPHYLSIFWTPLRTNPWDVIGGIIVVILLVGINVVGIREAAALNVLLAVVDFATQLLLVVLGFVLVFSPHRLSANVHWGVAPTWSAFALAIPVAMIAYTGIETVSNLAEEARDPRRSIPGSIRLVAVAVFAIYFTLPLVALSALPVHRAGGHYVTRLGLDPPHGFKNDPVLGLVANLHLHGTLLSAAKIYVGVLAATILFIATNAGVIGASRITYSMSSYRQLPEVFRRLHPRFKTPALALAVFAGLFSILFMLPGNVDFIGRMYAFGAMLSFTIAHASVIQMRRRPPPVEEPYRVPPSVRFRGVDWPLFAVLGGLGTAAAWIVVVVQDAPTRYAGLGWLAVGFVVYTIYRRRLNVPLARTMRAPIPLGPAVALEYRGILVPIVSGIESHEAIDLAARLAAERGATIVALRVLVVPMELPLDAPMPELEEEGDRLLDEARLQAETYGVRTIDRLVRARHAGRAIVDEAERRQTEIIVVGSRRGTHRRIFGSTVDYVLKNAPCRVMVAAGLKAA
ncbi:MAG: universal stress protein [Actinobacteria bacterium]|nr:universal stress protein [Actinomycetota bacterium]